MLERLRRLPPEGFDAAQSKLLRDDALSWMVRHPLDELTLIPRKLLYLGLGDSRAIQVGRSAEERQRLSGAAVTAGITPVIMDDARAAVLLGVIADAAWYGLLVLTALALLLLWRRLWAVAGARATIVDARDDDRAVRLRLLRQLPLPDAARAVDDPARRAAADGGVAGSRCVGGARQPLVERSS